MKGELYEYNGQKLSLADIAKDQDVNRTTLMDWYKKTGDMNSAVLGLKKSLAQRNISYNNEILSLKAISEKEKVKFETLKKHYDSTNDIYEAIRLTKESQIKRSGDILYNGKKMTIHAIAVLENVGNAALSKCFESEKDIYAVVEKAKQRQNEHNGTILYNGSLMSITAIAQLENIKRETLKMYYEVYKDIDKAVFITKESQNRHKKASIEGKSATYIEIAKYFDISPITLNQLIESGQTTDEIGNKLETENKLCDTIKICNQSLYSYCLEKSYNYWVIYYLIVECNKTAEEAIDIYLKNGQQMPVYWIYEKYDMLFKHLALSFGLDSNKIIKIMKDNNVNVENAICYLIFISNNRDKDFKLVEIYWMYELYLFLKNQTVAEIKESIKTFYITKRELDFIEEKRLQIKTIKRQLLLHEFSQIIDLWNISELDDMFKLYNITDEEKQSIVLKLYKSNAEKIIDPTEKKANRNLFLEGLILNLTISNEIILSDDELSSEEKEDVVKKRQLLTKICNMNFLENNNNRTS